MDVRDQNEHGKAMRIQEVLDETPKAVLE